MSLVDKRWAQKGIDLELDQVERVRATAAKWRDGLIALTAILTAVTIIKGPEQADALSSWGRVIVAVLLGLALAALMVGSLLAMRAAFGFPSAPILTTSIALRNWSFSEVARARRLLAWAVGLFFAGIALLAIAIAVTWFDDDLFPADPPAFLTVSARSFSKPICGTLVSSTPRAMFLKHSTETTTETTRIGFTDLRGIKLVAKCEADD